MYTLNLDKIQLEKKWNLQSPCNLQDFILPSVGASFKKWRCCTHTPPLEAQALATCKGPKRNFKKEGQKLFLKIGWPQVVRGTPCYRRGTVPGQRTARRRPTIAHRPRRGPPELSGCPFFFLPLCPIFSYVVNSSSLAPTHAHPCQTLPRKFKHP
jgi:hypothetical protein